ncbi:hypothetical protein TNIN_426441 [Trichonephila inaurata madagascariensis]|uniref:alkaline phosphatase n=1 Tax=Trichonephila inaurata madagascariensis TaxID=2747483 RepID=A0A8X7CKH6_9ARAC|nr:hypothetical protein TNIN_426441 [Trichonephila inaurata madagascariensis]
MTRNSSWKKNPAQLLHDGNIRGPKIPSPLEVILGGGRRHFLPRKENDPRMQTDMGRREDGRNLIDEWLRDKKTRELDYEYIYRKEDFDKVDPAKTDYLLGLFNHGHMAYGKWTETFGPDGGRIDHSHHFNNAHRALVDTLALEDAVMVALEMTKPEDTLMVVTSDHSHVFAFGGYPKRGNPILGLDDKTSDVDSMPYTTLLYANGPGYNHNFPMGRENLTGMNTEDKNYVQQSAVPRRWDTQEVRMSQSMLMAPWPTYSEVFWNRPIFHMPWPMPPV